MRRRAGRRGLRLSRSRRRSSKRAQCCFRTRELLVQQRTLDTVRVSHVGVVAPQGPANVKELALAVEEKTSLPLLVVELSRAFLEQVDGLSKKLANLANASEPSRATSQRLQSGRGADLRRLRLRTRATYGMLKRGRDFAAWLGLVPRRRFDRRRAGSWKIPRRWDNAIFGGC